MTKIRIILLTSFSLVAFAANSIFCRLALKGTNIDAATFTSIRLFSGAIALSFLTYATQKKMIISGNWISAFMLFLYAACFSFAYISLPAATGALLLFGAVQITMIGYGFQIGETLDITKICGIILAFAGLIYLLMPGIKSPSLVSSIFMLTAGVAWGIYSLRGTRSNNPTATTSGNFIRAIPFSIVLNIFMFDNCNLDNDGILLAVLSGVLASGAGYAIWYSVLPIIKSTNASVLQLIVPVLASLGGVIIIDEPLTLRIIIASIMILFGISLVLIGKLHTKTNT
ncbi:DMT family transporter [Leptospira vanthielii]|uniref:DMT family transporter n=1 Tax=Leptospira vanthielii TaxID=293085 RepID=A0ABY2NN70_9LEPT|nr:DMT family transporter [Leptospira vanthielii]TGM52483.1 DMT family transporter [Leptospira vanthielii]